MKNFRYSKRIKCQAIFLFETNIEGRWSVIYRPSSLKVSQSFSRLAVLDFSLFQTMTFSFFELNFELHKYPSQHEVLSIWLFYIDFSTSLFRIFSIKPFPCVIFYPDCLNRSYCVDKAYALLSLLVKSL